jgi:hypothetical protein
MGLFRTAGRVAVASSVHGRVQRRQRARWGEQERHAQEASQPVSPPPAPPAPDVSAQSKDTRAQLELLTQLGELRKAGVLTEEEFATKKAKILS